MDAWWQHEVLDRTVVQIAAPRVDVPEDPARVIPRNKRRLVNTYFGGEAFPVMFPVSIGMVAITAAYLGCPYEIIDTHTAWAHPIVDDWAERSPFAFDPENVWWQRSERLALDFYDDPQRIKPALAEINQAWYDVWRAATAISHQAGGYFSWLGMGSNRPAVDLQSDFSCMMSEAMFDEYFLPFIAQQTEWVDRTIYHLDGPGATTSASSTIPTGVRTAGSVRISLGPRRAAAGQCIHGSDHGPDHAGRGPGRADAGGRGGGMRGAQSGKLSTPVLEVASSPI